MKFKELPIPGAFAVDPEPAEDERGLFARTFCRDEFEKHGLNPDVAQCNTSFNRHKGTLRGMHYQEAPYAECKLVRCVSGSTHHVVIDLRSNSTTYMQWTSLRLHSGQRNMLYVPEGLAHGFLTLEDNSEVSYQMSEFYHPENAAGVRWDDPAFGIDWPGPVVSISDRDQCYPDFTAAD